MADKSRPPYLMAVLGVISLTVTAIIVLSLVRTNGPEQPALRGGAEPVDLNIAIPAFTLTDQTGQPFGSDDLQGKATIVNFIFTRCTGPCPVLTAAMAQMQNDLRRRPDWDEIRLVSFTVDAAYDTPQVLAEYAQRFGADPEHWRFLTGEPDQVNQLINEGFLQTAMPNPQMGGHTVMHTPNFVLLDRDGAMRGVYRGMDRLLPDGSLQSHERQTLLGDLDRLLREPAQ